MKHRSQHALRFTDGLSLELGARTVVMGVINVTPDSFSDAGTVRSAEHAARIAGAMLRAGAELIDVGGESTRPGAAPVPLAEEIARVVPAVEAIRTRTQARISVDTRRAEVARRALDAGADLVNDVSGLRDPEMLPLVCERAVPVVIMHMRGTPQTMQRHTRYPDVVRAVRGFLEDRAKSALAAGVGDDKILVDPGIGFGKSAAGNLEILRRLDELSSLGFPILVGVSRKSFIGSVLDVDVDQRLEGSLAAAVWAAMKGANVIRAHDVAATVRALRVADAIRTAGSAAAEAP